MRSYRWLLAALLLWFCGTNTGNAGTLLVYEGFDYPADSSIYLQNGGAGWSGGWGTPGGLDATVAPDSLSVDKLNSSGGALATAGSQPPNEGSSVATWVRLLATPLGADVRSREKSLVTSKSIRMSRMLGASARRTAA